MTETEIQKQITDVCRKSGYLIMRMNAGKGRGNQHLAPPGTPDLLVIGFKGGVLWIEVKTPAGVVSLDQEQMHAELRARGQTVIVAHGIEDLPWRKT